MVWRFSVTALDLTGRETADYNRVVCCKQVMRQQIAVTFVLLMLTSSMAYGIGDYQLGETSEAIDSPSRESDYPSGLLNTSVNPNPWVEPSLWERVNSGQGNLRITVITYSLRELNHWQNQHNQLEEQVIAFDGQKLVSTESSDGEIDHRTFWLDSNIFHKIFSIPGIIGILDAQNSPEPYDIAPLGEEMKKPESVRSGEIHGATDAWQRGYSGDGIVVAVADTGVDFAHPDLDGTQARIRDGSQYDGWPLMFDHNSMYHWMVNGQAYPSRGESWYADTSNLDYDNDSDGVLDDSGYDISGVPSSRSGVYHLGQHPDSTLRSQMGGDVPILVIDSISNGSYDVVIPDVNRNGNFSDDELMMKGNETAGLDEDGDGIRDVSAGLLYWISDGSSGVPYGDVYAGRHGYSNRIAGAGNLTLFMLDSGSHGTLCASAVAAQAQVNDGAVLGMAPNATIASIGNHYSGGHSLDGWRWIAEGNDGEPSTWDDQAHIGSFSFGYSSIDDSGADSYSLYLDWLTRIYNNQTHYAVAIGNGGHGYGTVKVPGAAQGIFSVGAFSSRTNMLWGQSAPWNNRGPNIVGRMDPDIVAVGWSATGDVPLNLRDDGNSATTTWGGTSLATPITAGLLAVVEQAWVENYGELPKSQPFRDFILSTADDRGYDPFVQGGGWFNASRSTAAIDGENGTFSFTPSQWMTGTFQGQHRDANINVIYPGESQTVSFEITNHGERPIPFTAIGKKHQAIDHQVGQWLSIGDGSSGGENNTWDGYQADRPDLLIPIHVNNTSYQLNPYTNLIRARAVIEYAAFDGDLDRSSDERIELKLYRWTDDDGDGIWVADEDNDSMVDGVDWTESSEFDEYAEWYMHGPQAELRVGLPFDDMGDGLFLGVSRRDASPSGLENVSIEWDWTAFAAVPDSWISTFHSVGPPIFLPGNSTISYNFTVTVPLDAEPGLHQHGLVINGRTLPIVTNVPYTAPININARPLDGNLVNQTLYDEAWISGAQRWSWRAESGDWRIMTVDWPESLDTGGTAIIDVDWDDNPYTDIDVLWMSQKPHEYHDEDPEAYGDSTFYIEERSTNNHRGSGRHDWGTYTGESREVFAVPVSAGLHQMALHTALHGVSTNDNPLNISVGYVAAEQSGFHKVVTDWSKANGTEGIYVVSTVPIPLESVESFGWTQPIYFDNETAYQDTSNDKMSASWWHNFSVENATELSISIDAYEEADLDLFLFRDDDEDGLFESGEEVARSWGSTSSESIEIDSPEDGNYSVAVHGWSVSETVQFWLDLEIIAGTSLRVLNATSLNESQINSQWPNGSDTLAGAVPSAAIEFLVDYDMPLAEGYWEGHVEVALEGGVEITMPFIYELVDLEPELEFVTPENLTQTNVVLPISLHAKDIGSGFNLSDLTWAGLDNNTSVPNATTVEATLSNLSSMDITSTWNSGNHSTNLTFREIWINTTLPSTEQWHDYVANIADISGRQALDWLSVKYDTTAPILLVSDIPVITSESLLEISIQTEWDAELSYNGQILETNSSGESNLIINLDESQELKWRNPAMASKSGYLVNGNNTFSFSVSDPAGNQFNRSFEVVLDSTKPEIFSSVFSSENSMHLFDNWSWSGPTLNVTNSALSFEVTPDIQSICIDLISNTNDFVIENCKVDSSLLVTQQHLGFPSNSEFYTPFLLDLNNISDGGYHLEVELVDWANNTNQYTYPLVLDRTLPEVDWDISPSSEGILSDHRLGLSWTSSENIELEFLHNGEMISQWNASYGGHFFELNFTGEHEFCILAWDSTKGQVNENHISECRTFMLEPSLYASAIWASWDGTVVGTETVNLTFSRGPNQTANITHIPAGANVNDLHPTYSFEPGMSFVEVELALEEGENEFLLSVRGLDQTQLFRFYVERDTITPVIELTEIGNRTTNLGVVRVVEGICEPRASVSVWTEVASTSFVCGPEGNFSLQMGVPANASWHIVRASTEDLGGNTNSTSIEVLYQEWLDWAIDDAEAGGPMLYWALGLVLAVFSMLGLTSWGVRRRRVRLAAAVETASKEAESAAESIEEVGDWLDDMLNETAPLEPSRPLPEEEELRAWARGERDVQDWRDRIPDDETSDNR